MTTKMLEELKRLHGEGLVDREISEEMGIGFKKANYWRQKIGLPPNRGSTRYTVYDRSTSAFLVEGTARKCSEFLGIKVNSFWRAACRSRKGQGGKYEIYGVEA